MKKHGQDYYMPLEANSAAEDRRHVIPSPGSSKPQDSGAAGTRACSTCFARGALVASLGTMALILGLSLFGALQQQQYDVRMNNAISADTGGDRFRYPTDFLRDVVPIPCHSHNDYWRAEPLFSALRAGCISVEADVWLPPSHPLDGDPPEPPLLVGHDPAALTPRRTFASLYVDPLVELLTRMNPPLYHHHHPNQTLSHRGVFDADPAQTLVLLVDVKTGGAATWPRVLAQLEPLRSRGWLTHSDGDGREIRERPVTVVGTGNAPSDRFLLAGNGTYPYRDAFFDAPLRSLSSSPEYDRTNSLYASASFGEAVGPVTGGQLSEDQLGVLRAQVAAARGRGLKARYWGTPSWPVGLRNRIWRVLVEEGADILNVDDLRAASQSVW